MVTLYDSGVYLLNGKTLVPEKDERAAALDKAQAKKGTIAYGILQAHNTSGDPENLKIRYDAITSHDLTYVGIIQTARASGLDRFPLPYVLTCCHNSLCAVGGMSKGMVDMLDQGLVDMLLDTQDFDLFAVNSVQRPNHHHISADAYVNPFNKGSFVNKLDYVVLAALEVDTHFNCNVVVGSDGMITGAQGGHPDAVQGAKCTIVICPLLQGRIPAICTDVTTVTAPGSPSTWWSPTTAWP